MRNLFIAIFLVTIPCFSLSQNIQLEKIKETTTNPNSNFYYEKLIQEFQTNPQSFLLDSEKGKHIYYGKLYSPYYKESSKIKANYLKFIRQAGAKKYSKAILLGEQLLEKDPINLMVIMNLITCYQNSEGDNKNIKRLASQAEILMKAIANNGDGKSKETAFKVITLADEITLLNYIKVDIEKYNRNTTIINSELILDNWTKQNEYNYDHRNEIYIEVFHNNTKMKL